MTTKYLKEASDNFFKNILGLDIQKCKTDILKNLYYSKISIYKDDQEYDISFFFKKDTLNLISKNLMLEKCLNDDAMIDLLKETSNLIAGEAKTLLEEVDENSTYRLSTPKYIGYINDTKKFNFSHKIIGKLNNRCFMIGLEEV